MNDHDHDHDHHDHGPDDHGPDDHGHDHADDARRMERLTAALLALDDDALRAGLAGMHEQSRRDLATQLALPAAATHMGTGLTSLFRRKLATATPAKQLAAGFALTEPCNEATIEALGDRHDDPSHDDLLEVLPPIVEAHGAPTVTLMLASYALSEAPCREVMADLLDTDERFALGSLEEYTPPPPGRLHTAPPPSAEEAAALEAKRAARREAKAAKHKAEQTRKAAVAAGRAKSKQTRKTKRH